MLDDTAFIGFDPTNPDAHQQSMADYDSDSDEVHMAASTGGGSAVATTLPSAGAAPSSQATALLGEVRAGSTLNHLTTTFVCC